MLLVAITPTPIAASLQGFRVDQIALPGAVATIVTDGARARLVVAPDGFSVAEAPTGRAGDPASAAVALVYDGGRRTVDLRRDMRGGRALYHHITGEGGLVVSTHVSMLRAAGVAIEENEKALPEFFAYRTVAAPRTLYKGIEQVPGGGRVRIDSIEGRHAIRELDWGRPRRPAAEPAAVDEAASVAATREALDRAVVALHPHRGGIAVLLSGGLDSSVLARLCQIHHGIDRSYSAGFSFEHPAQNVERDYAVSAAIAFGTRHVYFESTASEYLHDFVAAIAAAEAPVHHLQSVLLYALFERGMDPRERLVICGEGADGIFGDFLHNALFAQDQQYGFLRARRMLRQTMGARPAFAFLRAASAIAGRGRLFLDYLDPSSPVNRPLADTGHVLWSLGRYGDVEWIQAFLGVPAEDIIAGRYRSIAALKDESLYDVVTAYSSLRVAQTQTIWSSLAEASGKIVDYPYLDPDVAQRATALPWPLKLQESKYVLRQIARGLGIAESIITRPKASFGIAPSRWASRDGVFEPIVPLAARVIDLAEIRALQSITDHDKAMMLWTVLNYALWKRLCIQDEPLERLQAELAEAVARARR